MLINPKIRWYRGSIIEFALENIHLYPLPQLAWEISTMFERASQKPQHLCSGSTGGYGQRKRYNRCGEAGALVSVKS